MPLKHHTETAYLLVLAIAIAVAGIAASLLPKLPAGLPYWLGLLFLSAVYPLILTRTFKENRADYEFRMLHWFPAAIFVLWGILEMLSPRFKPLYILELGFLYLWSLPLVVLGIAFIILFALHVIRRSRLRVTVLSLILILFCAGAVAAEAMNWNAKLQAVIFPKNSTEFVATLRTRTEQAGRFVSSTASTLFANLTGSTSSVSSSVMTNSSATMMAGSSFSSSASSVQSSAGIFAMQSSSRVAMQSSSQGMTMSSLSSSRPTRLPNSGPEAAGVLATFLLAGYSAIVHRRSANRV